MRRVLQPKPSPPRLTVGTRCPIQEMKMPKEPGSEKRENEGREFRDHGMSSSDMDGHRAENKSKIEMGKETSHPSKRR